jgi:ATP-dependent DNA helicase RecG
MLRVGHSKSGERMTALMYELAVREAKDLPNFAGTDEYFVKLALGGKIIDRRMLALIKKNR